MAPTMDPLPRNFQCTTCKKRFRSKCNLKQHQVTHDANRPRNFECSICKNKYYNHRDLKKHLEIHSRDGKPHQCPICFVRFTVRGSVKRHIQCYHSRTTAKFKCLFCPKQFNGFGELEEHMNSHTKEKPYFCKHCPQECSQKCSLIIHMKRKHNPKRENNFKCDLCPKAFNMASLLRSHLLTHVEEKAFKCEFCDREFRHGSSYRDHRRIHTGEKPYACDLCPKRFYRSSFLKQHLISHSGRRDFKCDLCEKAFTQHATLFCHKKICKGKKEDKPKKVSKKRVSKQDSKAGLDALRLAESKTDSYLQDWLSSIIN